jgi:flagellar basal body-associated protein FliL
MGFSGNVLWIMIVMLFFPFTALGVLLYLAFVPWPIHRELKNVKAQRSVSIPPNYQPVDPIDVELDRMRGDMGLNQMKKRKRES